jgi:late competence protein required for DNA uptake (superfamily II DNA/RNA helicase)
MTVANDSTTQEWDKSLHTLVMGPAGCGETRILKQMVQQLLEDYQNGEKLGITLIEPKGDLTQDVVKLVKRISDPLHNNYP